MQYENYLNSLRRNLSEVSRAKKKGVQLSRLENFDFLFKKELARVEGLISKRGVLSKVVNSISDADYRLACFYANGISDIMDMVKSGYSVYGVKSQLKSFVKTAEAKYICRRGCRVEVSDLNGEILVTVSSYKSENTFCINDIYDYVKVALFTLSLVGSLDEEDGGYEAWFNTYLKGEFYKIAKGYSAEVYIEREKVAKDLKSYMLTDRVEKAEKKVNGRVIKLAK